MKKAKPAPPDTKRPLLPSAGRPDGRATRHEFVDTVPGEFVVSSVCHEQYKSRGNAITAPAWIHLFRCVETGAIRKWGIE